MKIFETLKQFEASMANVLTTPIEIENVGTPESPRQRLVSTCQIGGRWFHYLAIEIDPNTEEARHAGLIHYVNYIRGLCDGYPQTFAIEGRMYVDCFFPFAS